MGWGKGAPSKYGGYVGWPGWSGMGTGTGAGGAASGSVFSSFGCCVNWPKGSAEGSSLETSQSGLNTRFSSDFKMTSGRQKSPVLRTQTNGNIRANHNQTRLTHK